MSRSPKPQSLQAERRSRFNSSLVQTGKLRPREKLVHSCVDSFNKNEEDMRDWWPGLWLEDAHQTLGGTERQIADYSPPNNGSQGGCLCRVNGEPAGGRMFLEGSLEEAAPDLELGDGSGEKQERGCSRGECMLQVTEAG